MSLAIEAAIVLGLMIAFGVLNVVAKRRDLEGFRRRAMTRRLRVPLDANGRPVVDAPDPHREG